MLKIVFNEDGSINELIVMESINQGSNNVNKVFASILGRSNEDYTCVGEFELPSGDLEELSGVVDSQEVGVNTYNGYTISLAESVTRQAGNLKLNLKLIDLQDNVLCTYQVTLKVNKTGYEPNTTHITEEQYNSLLQSFNSKYAMGNGLLFFEKYTDFPNVGSVNIIYCVPNENYETNHLYDEYTWNPSTNTYNFFGYFLNALFSFYPVGAIYMSTVSTSPASLFGGTWEQLENRFLLGAGSNYSAGAIGGEAEHTLIESELPNHKHTMYGTNGNYPYPCVYGTFHATGSAHGVYIEGVTRSAGEADTENYIESGGTGNNVAHNNMPPYLVVYMWKRVA